MKISLRRRIGKGKTMRFHGNFRKNFKKMKPFVSIFSLFLTFLIAFLFLNLELSSAGVLVPPPKLMYKYNPNYRNPFDPTNRSKLPPPPDKYKFNLKDSRFFRRKPPTCRKSLTNFIT